MCSRAPCLPGPVSLFPRTARELRTPLEVGCPASGQVCCILLCGESRPKVSCPPASKADFLGGSPEIGSPFRRRENKLIPGKDCFPEHLRQLLFLRPAGAPLSLSSPEWLAPPILGTWENTVLLPSHHPPLTSNKQHFLWDSPPWTRSREFLEA